MWSGVTEQFLHVLVFMWSLQCTFKLCTKQTDYGFWQSTCIWFN